MSEVVVDDKNFETEVINSDVPVLVDFWAPWCMPCKMIAPILEEIAGAFAGKLKVAKLDVDSAPQLAQQYGVISIPTLKVFKKGEVVNEFVGAGSRDNIEALFLSHLDE